MKKFFSITWKKYHKWIGLIGSVFMLVFCISGIILNHRSAVAPYNVSRSFMPSSYKIADYNNGIVRGTFALSSDSILMYGGCGIWLTDSTFRGATNFNAGLPGGIDNRNTRNIVKSADGTVWCATQFGFYMLNGNSWQEIELADNASRISDIALSADSTEIIVVTRSNIYRLESPAMVKTIELKAPDGEKNRVTLFKTIWHLHSGELFGLPGRIVVDIVAIILIFLSITAIILFILPYSMRRRIKRGAQPAGMAKNYKWNFKWHNKIGYTTLVLTIIVVFTGMCLRPPLLIPFAITKTAPLVDSGNFWGDKLRAIRYDEENECWLLSTSEGFYQLADLTDTPVKIPAKGSPVISPMGINVFHREKPGVWLIGSFSGLYRWDTKAGTITMEEPGLINGYSTDTPQPTVFFYDKGAEGLPPMPEILANQPISLWNFALELHVGRCYTPILGPLSALFIFISGALILLILISGYILNRRKLNKNNK